MLRAVHLWLPAVAMLVTFGAVTIVLTMEPAASASSPLPAPAAAVANTAPAAAEAPSEPAPALDSVAVEAPAVPRPRGILTYLAGDGTYVAVRAAVPTDQVEITELNTEASALSGAGGVYASPDRRYEATVRRDETGVWLDVSSDSATIQTLGIAGPDDRAAVAGTKALAAAVEGVPLTVAWSPDSRYLAYGSITGAPFSLAVVRIEGWDFTFRRVAGGYVGELAWAPDSSRLAVSTYEIDRLDHTALMYNPDGGSIRRLIDGCAVVWAPDSDFLAVHREPSIASGVWITSPDGVTQIEATGDAHTVPIAWVRQTS